MGPRFRSMMGRDLPELMSMSRDNMSHIIWMSWGLPWRDDNLLEILTDPENVIEVMENEGQIVAYFCVERHPRSLFISSIQVRKGWRGKGIGRAMMERVEAMALLQGLNAVELWVQNMNRRAISFYRYLGYRFVAQRGSNYLMRKRLDRWG